MDIVPNIEMLQCFLTKITLLFEAYSLDFEIFCKYPMVFSILLSTSLKGALNFSI